MSIESSYAVAEKPQNLLFDMLRIMPFHVFGASLGTMGVALLPVPDQLAWLPINNFFAYVGTVCFFVLLVLQGAKLIFFPDSVIADFKNPALMPFTAQMIVALFLLTEIAHQHNFHIAIYLYYFSALLAALQFFLWCAICVVKVKSYNLVTPAWLIPPVSFLYCSELSFAFQYALLGMVLLAVGAAALMFSSFLLIKRKMNKTFPAIMAPGLTIFVAGPALCLLVALELLQPDSPEYLVLDVLYIVNAVLFIIAALTFAPLMRKTFSISWWAYTMPLSASAIAQYQYAIIVNTQLVMFAQMFSLVALVVTLIVMAMAAARVKNLMWNDQ